MVCGSIALDDVITTAGSVTGVPGGSALYFAYAASYFNKVQIVSVVGRDFPQSVLNDMISRDMDLSCLRIRHDEETFHWFAEYDESMNGRRTRRLNPNADRTFDPSINSTYRNAPYIFLASLEPVLQAQVLNQILSPKIVGLDTIECYLRNDMAGFIDLMSRVDVLFLNDEESLCVADVKTTFAALLRLSEMGPRYIVVKKGSSGALLCSEGRLFAVPAFSCDRVADPTGAGDAFGGGFIGYLSSCRTIGWTEMKNALLYASVVASFTIEDFSVSGLSRCTREDIDRRFEQFRDIAVRCS